MRAGLSTILQTLTPEAASVLNHAIGEAGRRNHGQTTPLHVAATLLASPSGFLRQACIRSHPNSSHPLQCRALELCFSVALDRLPASQTSSPGTEPPISNALMAALKRAQAHQRRGCPEQQQQPLLAVKVELEQLIISILDDPSVSRVMREASFSSPAVKATIEQSVNSSPPPHNPSLIGLGFRPIPSTVGSTGRNLYLNPRLQQHPGFGGARERGDEVKRVADILMRTRKRNPILVGDSEPEVVMKEILRRIEKAELGEGVLKNVQIVSLESHVGEDRAQIPSRLKELGEMIETRLGKLNGAGVILDLGDLKWLVDQPPGLGNSGALSQPPVPKTGQPAVAEMAKLLGRFAEGSSLSRLWLLGTATCETYLRCQVYHPSMENDWDLQAVPIAPRAPPAGVSRLGTSGILGNSIENLNSSKIFPAATPVPPRRASVNIDPARRTSCCPQCTENCEQELAKLLAEEFDKSSSGTKPEAAAAKSALPLWLQNAKAHNADAKASGNQSQTKDQEMLWNKKSQELQKKWADTCSHRHPHYHQNLSSDPVTQIPPIPGLYNSSHNGRQVPKSIGETLQLNSNLVEALAMPPRSPVRTDLALGQTKTEEAHKERVKDFLGCISSELQNRILEPQGQKMFSTLDADSFKKLLKGLIQKVWWQREAASAVAATVTRSKSGSGKCRGGGSKGDVWLMFTGPDRVGKRRMAAVLSELVCGTNPVMLCLGSRRDGEEPEAGFRGKTTLDRISEAVRRNPFSVILIEDVDEADALVCGSIKRAMERGRIADSYGREVSLGNVIFILTTANRPSPDEKKLVQVAAAGGNWQLRLLAFEKTAKRPANWATDEDRRTKLKKEMSSTPSFDLNLAADAAEEDGSGNSSDLTVDHEDERGGASPSHQLLESVDDAVVFKPVDFSAIRHDIASSIASKFSSVIGSEGCPLEVEDEALGKILGGVWLGQAGLEEWSEKVLVPSFRQLKGQLPSSETPNMVFRLESSESSGNRSCGEWLPDKIHVVVDGLGL